METNKKLQRKLSLGGQLAPNGKVDRPIRVSKNVYELIFSMNLGNLSAMKEIPQFYIGLFLQYIMQVSLAFIHAH